MDDEDNRIIITIAVCKTEECLEVIIQAHVPSGTTKSETPGTGRFSKASAMSRSIPVCPPVIEELRQVRCAPI